MKSSVPQAYDGYRAGMSHCKILFGRGANRFLRFFAAPMRGSSSEVLIYLRVLAMVTFVAEATGREFMVDASHPPQDMNQFSRARYCVIASICVF